MNQCMGCQAGWPLRPSKFGSHLVHQVAGGYPHEVVACTKDRYEIDRSKYVYEGPNGTPRPKSSVSPDRKLRVALADLVLIKTK